MKKANQHTLHGKQTQDIFDMLLDATIQWDISSDNQTDNFTDSSIHYRSRAKRTLPLSTVSPAIGITTNYNVQTTEKHLESLAVIHEKYSIEEHIAHIFHFASVAILGIISIEVCINSNIVY